MSTTRTVDDLQILLAQHDIEAKDANTFTAQYEDKPKIIHALCDLIEAFYKNEALADQLGVGKNIQDLIGYIPEVIFGIEEEQKKHPENKHALTGEDLVLNAIENITALFDPTKLASLAKKDTSSEEKGKEMIAPLEQALNQVQTAALPTSSTPQNRDMIVMGFIGCGFILGGIACLAIGIASMPFAGPAGLAGGLYGATQLIGMGAYALWIAHSMSPPAPIKTKAADARRRKESGIELGHIRLFNHSDLTQESLNNTANGKRSSHTKK
jgi:hypothetical protein